MAGRIGEIGTLDGCFSYSAWSERKNKLPYKVTNGKFHLNLSPEGICLIRATIKLSRKTFETDRALIDSGASNTIISKNLIGSSEGMQIGTMNLRTSNGFMQKLPVYRADILLPSGICVEALPVIVSDSLSGDVDMLIGLDILKCGIFILDGPGRTMSFETK